MSLVLSHLSLCLWHIQLGHVPKVVHAMEQTHSVESARITYIDAQLAFCRALETCRLSQDKSAPNYVGDFMYMFTQDGVDMFKHCATRRYLEVGK